VALIAALAALQLHAFWPGVVTPDSLSQYAQAVSGQYQDWHPPMMAFIWRQLARLAPGQAPFLVLDALLYWTGIGLLADAMRREGRPLTALAIVAVAAIPIPLGELGAVVKDTLLAAACLAATGLAAQERRWMRPLAALLLVVAAATRFNAAFAAAPLLMWLLPARWSASLSRYAVLLCAALALLASTSWLINQVALAPLRTHPMNSLIGFDLAGIIAHGGDARIPPYSAAASRAIAAQCYTPAQFNPHYREDCDRHQDDLSKAAGIRLMPYWLATIAHYPLAWFGHRLAHLNRNWRFLLAQVPDDAVFIMRTPANDLGLSYYPSGAALAIYGAASAIARSPLGRPATWLTVAGVLLLLAPRLRHRRAVTALSLSALLYGGAYAVVSVAPDLRYNLWTMIAALLALALAAADLRALPRSRLAWGGLAVGGVMLLEAGWTLLALPPPL
jgi:hypothetical protein